jgi:hypothetical protein
LECQCSYAALWRRTEEESFPAVVSYTGTQEKTALMQSLKIPYSFIAELSKRFGDEEMIQLTLAEFSHFQCEETPPPHDISTVWCLALRQGKELIGVQVLGYQQWPGFAGGKRRVAHGIAQIASLGACECTTTGRIGAR